MQRQCNLPNVLRLYFTSIFLSEYRVFIQPLNHIINSFLYVLIGTACSDFSDEDDKGEYGDAFEGDMLLNAEQFAALFNIEIATASKPIELWPNAIVHYELSINFTEAQNRTILKAMKAVETVSCMKFEEKKSENGYIKFQVSMTSIKPVKSIRSNHIKRSNF